MATGRETIVVTGAAGFIGSHLVEALLGRAGDSAVIGVDNFDPFYDPKVKQRNLAALRAHPAAADRFRFVEADICDAGAMADVFERNRPKGVLHMAAKAGVRPSIVNPVGYARANILGTAVLLEAAKQVGCSRFVMASSSSVYGNNPKVPFSESDDVSRPISPYASTKRSCELLCHAHWHLTKMPTACLRFFTVFGPRQRPDLAIAKFLKMISSGETIPFYGDGSSSRDYTFIDDIVAGVLASYDRISKYGYRIYNLGGSDPVTLTDMVNTIGEVVGREPILDRQPMQPGDVERTFADLTLVKNELGFNPTTRLRDGIAKQWEWMQSEQLSMV